MSDTELNPNDGIFNEVLENNSNLHLEISDEEELITAQKVLESLESAWINERLAPDILPHETEILDLMLSQVAHMEANIKSLNKNDLRTIAHKMELDRIKYIMASYLRCRLEKIEEFTTHILNEEENLGEENQRLSSEELRFAREYSKNMNTCFHQVALQYLPTIQAGDAEQRIVRPNLMSHVFIKAKESLPAVVVGVDDEEVDLAKDSQHIVPYQLVADLINKKKVQLI